MLALATVSDGFIYLVLQRRMTFSASFIPLLYVVTSLFYLLLAIPMGRIADRFGRGRVFVGGYTLLLLAYAGLLVPMVGLLEVLVVLLLYGTYYAATDGVLMALASDALAPELRTSGMALLTTATGVARLVASLVFGAVWTWWGADVATTAFVLGLAAALVFGAVTMARRGMTLTAHGQAVAGG